MGHQLRLAKTGLVFSEEAEEEEEAEVEEEAEEEAVAGTKGTRAERTTHCSFICCGTSWLGRLCCTAWSSRH